MGEPTIYKPSIYNGNGIYKNGASGGGGIAIPGNIKLYSALVRVSTSPYDGFEVNKTIKGDDRIDIIVFPCYGLSLQYSNEVSFEFQNDKRVLGINTQGSYGNGTIQITYYNSGLYGSASFSNNSNGFLISLRKDYAKINNTNMIISGSYTDYTTTLKKIWARTGYGVSPIPFVRCTIFDKDNKKKFDFVPAKNTDDNKVGIFELINGEFFPSTNFNVIGEPIN